MLRDYLPPLSPDGVRWAKFLGLIAGIVAFVWLVVWLRDVLTPLAAAMAIAYILNPPVTWLERRRNVPRIVSVSVGLALLGLSLVVVTLQGAVQTIEFAQRMPTYVARVIDWTKTHLTLDVTLPLPDMGEPDHDNTLPADPTDPQYEPDDASSIDEPIGTPIDWSKLAEGTDWRGIAARYGPMIGRITNATTQVIADQAARVGYWLTLAVLIPFYTFFFLLHFNQIVATVRDHLPGESRDTIVRVVVMIDKAIASFFRGRVVVSAIVALLSAVGWGLIGLENSLLLGLLAGVLNLVPYLSIFALVPALLMAFFGTPPGESWVWMLAYTFAVFMIVQAIESFILSPISMAQSSGLHSITTVVALFIGGKIAGLLGMLLAIPIASTLKSLAVEYLLPEVRRLANESAGPDPPEAPNTPVDQPRTPEQS